ncbi:MAG: oxidative damage protection protein [Gammaproteobacteria bacterium]|nr:MAG: oxidative damage protection protein [Gammaproteobacteria bacterium]
MSRTVQCVKLGKQAEGLPAAPVPGELGKRIYENVCQEAWQLWLKQQTILINEHRLSMIDPEAQKFLQQQMQAFFFGDGVEMPGGFIPK